MRHSDQVNKKMDQIWQPHTKINYSSPPKLRLRSIQTYSKKEPMFYLCSLKLGVFLQNSEFLCNLLYCGILRRRISRKSEPLNLFNFGKWTKQSTIFLLQFSCRGLTSEWHLQTGFTDSQSDSQFLTKPEIFTTSENSNINPKWMFCPVDLALPEAKWTLRYMYKRVTPAGSKFEFSWVVLSSLYFSWHQRSEFQYN